MELDCYKQYLLPTMSCLSHSLQHNWWCGWGQWLLLTYISTSVLTV